MGIRLADLPTLGDLFQGEGFTTLDLLRKLRANFRVVNPESPLVLILGIVRLLLVLGLALVEEEDALDGRDVGSIEGTDNGVRVHGHFSLADVIIVAGFLWSARAKLLFLFFRFLAARLLCRYSNTEMVRRKDYFRV